MVVLKNPSPAKHYFSTLRFAAAAWTRKVEVGAVREIEVKPRLAPP
jgi:hypothetical protein